MPYAVTANRLRDGRVVFRTAEGLWSPDMADSAIETDEAQANAIVARIQPEADAQDVVDVYAVELDASSPHPRPLRLREAIRALGPTISYMPQPRLEAAE